MGKILVATFNEDEDLVLDRVISVLGKDCLIESHPAAVLYFEHELEIHPQHHRVLIARKEVALSHYEYGILYFLARHPGWVFSKEQIFEEVWHLESDSCFSAVANTMSRLRKKIEPNPQFPIYIQTVPGHGYKFCPQSSNNNK